jgi:hypothetical protein
MVFGSPTVFHWVEPSHIKMYWVITGGPQYPQYKTPTVSP